MISETTVLTPQTIAAHTARCYSNMLRFNVGADCFEEKQGVEWVVVDSVRVQMYVRAAMNQIRGYVESETKEDRERIEGKLKELLCYSETVESEVA
jgi:hypothetical protein